MMYINIEKKAAITRLLLSLPVLSIQIMFSFSFSVYFESFKYYKYYNYLCIKELYKYIYLLISYEFLDCFMHKIKCRRRKMILAIIFTFQLTIVSLLCLEIVLFTIWYLNDGWGHRLSMVCIWQRLNIVCIMFKIITFYIIMPFLGYMTFKTPAWPRQSTKRWGP